MKRLMTYRMKTNSAIDKIPEGEIQKRSLKKGVYINKEANFGKMQLEIIAFEFMYIE